MNIIIAGALHADKTYEEKLLVQILKKRLKEAGHNVDSFFLPFGEDSKTVINEIMAFRLIDISVCDLLITIGYPACFLEHHNKKIILFDTYPQLFEYLGTQYGYDESIEIIDIKQTITNMEKIIFQRSDIICFSEILKKDIYERYGIEPLVLKLTIEEKYFGEVIENLELDKYYIISTDLSEEDRVLEKVINQFESSSTIKILLSINRSSESKVENLQKQIKESGLENRIILVKGTVSDNIFKKALGYIYTGYKKRKLPWGLLRAVQNNIKIYTFDDTVIEEFEEYGYNFIPINNINNIENDTNTEECKICNKRYITLEELINILV